jgi:hypothetical protein
MTTKVVISSPNPNHENVLVRTVNPNDGTQVVPDMVLTDGESCERYVHSTSRLEISEVPKVTQPVGDGLEDEG